MTTWVATAIGIAVWTCLGSWIPMVAGVGFAMLHISMAYAIAGNHPHSDVEIMQGSLMSAGAGSLIFSCLPWFMQKAYRSHDVISPHWMPLTRLRQTDIRASDTWDASRFIIWERMLDFLFKGRSRKYFQHRLITLRPEQARDGTQYGDWSDPETLTRIIGDNKMLEYLTTCVRMDAMSEDMFHHVCCPAMWGAKDPLAMFHALWDGIETMYGKHVSYHGFRDRLGRTLLDRIQHTIARRNQSHAVKNRTWFSFAEYICITFMHIDPIACAWTLQRLENMRFENPDIDADSMSDSCRR
jgi:hypothetical protein